MAINQINKLVWIVDTIYKARKITFEELNKKWIETDMSGGEEMVKRTFFKWKESIFETFGLLIECEKTYPYYHYIENEDDIKHGNIGKWLLSTYSVCNSLIECKAIKNRILLEDVPSGREYLDKVIDAMKKNIMIHITYYNYWRGDTREHYIMPLFVKLFRQRWYMVGRSWPQETDMIFCLDRIKEFRLSSHSFEYPDDFDPQTYFNGCFGIIAGENKEAEDVILKVNAIQANYLRDLPMHESQEEIERHDKYSIFKLHVRPTYDFQQEILWNREEIEVLEPEWLRNEIVKIINTMLNKYKG